MRNLILYLAVFFLTGCFYNDVNIKGTTAGISNSVVEISNGKNLWSENISKSGFDILAKVEQPGFYTLRILFSGEPGKTVEHIIYLENGDYNINIDSTNLRTYPEIESESETQKDLNRYMDPDNLNTAKGAGFMINNPNSLVSAYFLSLAEDEIIKDPKYYKEIYDKLSPEIKDTEYAKRSKKMIDGYLRTMTGADMPDIKGIMSNGKPFNRDLIKGKLTLIAFWASWNDPSKKDIALLKNMYNELQPQGFEIVGIAIDKYEDRWKKFIKANELNWLHVADFKGAYSANFEQFNTNKLPYYIIVGPDLKMVDYDVPVESVTIYFNDFIRNSSVK
ncbi:MAG: TlpA family protein disulfide reductase [Sphingobacteriaceae bacterium]